MLGALLFLGALGVSGVLCAKDNYEMKKTSFHYDEDGNSWYYDRKCNRYINGEKTELEYREDENGITHRCIVGTQSKKVYKDSYDPMKKQRDWLNDKDYQRNIKSGKKAFNKFDPRFASPVTIEMDTGKIITCLYKGTNRKTGIEQCRKFYLHDDMIAEFGKYAYNKTSPGDKGIPISEEEYNQLDIACPGYTKMPDDFDVVRELWGLD